MSHPRPASRLFSKIAPLTDSPWFWVLLFSATAMLMLAIVAPRYAARQRRLEMQYYARQEIERREVEGTNVSRDPGEEGSAAPPAAGELIIPLWPLAAVCAALTLVSAICLWHSQRPLGESSSPSDRGPAP